MVKRLLNQWEQILYVVKDNRGDFGKYISYNYNYIGSVIEVNGKFYNEKV